VTDRSAGQVALLRGINVGGHNLVPMPRLRAVFEGLGLDAVRTHLQSGNVVFRSEREPEDVAAEAERALHRELGLTIRVVVRTHAELGRVLRADPFPGADPSRHMVTFLSAAPPKDAADRLGALARSGEQIVAGRHEVHVFYPEGAGRSNVSGAVLEKSGLVATTRNWRTVTRLHAMTSPEEAPE
jgi:uncharacterized protein (DUF1697 family)